MVIRRCMYFSVKYYWAVERSEHYLLILRDKEKHFRLWVCVRDRNSDQTL